MPDYRASEACLALVAVALRDDAVAEQKLSRLLQSKPTQWLNLLAGMPSTRWLAILRPYDTVGQHICCGPTRKSVADLGRAVCGLRDAAWLQYAYPGPLNYAGQRRLKQQSEALHRLLSRCVASRHEARLAFVVHVAGHPFWQFHHSRAWDAADALRALMRAFALFDIFPLVHDDLLDPVR